MSLRTDRVAEAIREELMTIIQRELKDPGIGVTSITHVEVSGDLRHASVLFSVLGDEEERNRTLEALERAKKFIRSELGKRVKLRFTPELAFKLDESLEERLRIAKILDEIKEKETHDG